MLRAWISQMDHAMQVRKPVTVLKIHTSANQNEECTDQERGIPRIYSSTRTHTHRMSNEEWNTNGGHSKSGLPISLAVSKNLRLSLNQRTV